MALLNREFCVFNQQGLQCMDIIFALSGKSLVAHEQKLKFLLTVSRAMKFGPGANFIELRGRINCLPEIFA